MPDNITMVADYSLDFMRRLFHMWRLFCHYLSFSLVVVCNCGTPWTFLLPFLGRLCFVIVAFSGYLHLYLCYEQVLVIQFVLVYIPYCQGSHFFRNSLKTILMNLNNKINVCVFQLLIPF